MLLIRVAALVRFSGEIFSKSEHDVLSAADKGIVLQSVPLFQYLRAMRSQYAVNSCLPAPTPGLCGR
jgi:hypothetical protein